VRNRSVFWSVSGHVGASDGRLRTSYTQDSTRVHGWTGTDTNTATECEPRRTASDGRRDATEKHARLHLDECIPPRPHTGPSADAVAHEHAHKHTHARARAQTHTCTRTQTHTCTSRHTNTHTHARARTITGTHTLTRPLTHTHARARVWVSRGPTLKPARCSAAATSSG
jgi:hypothetical protein